MEIEKMLDELMICLCLISEEGPSGDIVLLDRDEDLRSVLEGSVSFHPDLGTRRFLEDDTQCWIDIRLHSCDDIVPGSRESRVTISSSSRSLIVVIEIRENDSSSSSSYPLTSELCGEELSLESEIIRLGVIILEESDRILPGGETLLSPGSSSTDRLHDPSGH